MCIVYYEHFLCWDTAECLWSASLQTKLLYVATHTGYTIGKTFIF